MGFHRRSNEPFAGFGEPQGCKVDQCKDFARSVLDTDLIFLREIVEERERHKK